jgi:hypothetical protein
MDVGNQPGELLRRRSARPAFVAPAEEFAWESRATKFRGATEALSDPKTGMFEGACRLASSVVAEVCDRLLHSAGEHRGKDTRNPGVQLSPIGRPVGARTDFITSLFSPVGFPDMRLKIPC